MKPVTILHGPKGKMYLHKNDFCGKPNYYFSYKLNPKKACVMPPDWEICFINEELRLLPYIRKKR